MPIRKRNKLWQADVMTSLGTRVRKSFTTKAEAQQFLKGNVAAPPKTPPPVGRFHPYSGGSLAPGSRPDDAQQSKPLSPAAEVRTQTRSPRAPSPIAAKAGQNFGPAPVSTINAASAGASSTSAHPSRRTTGFRTSPVPRLQPSPSPTKFERVFAVSDNPTRLQVLLCRDAALRAGTAAKLTPANIVGEEIVAKTKRDASIRVPMSPRLAAMVGAAVRLSPDSTTPLIVALGLTAEWAYSAINQRLRAAHKRAGTSGWGWHSLRRTAAQRLYRATGSLHAVQSLLGHSSIHVSLHYLNAAQIPITSTLVNLFASGEPKEGTK
jgi:integrase